MATWGYYNFDNDAAADISTKFRDTHSLGLLTEALTSVTTPDAVEAEAAQQALAAAEIVAALFGKPGRDLPADLLPLTVRLSPEEEPTFRNMATQAVEAIAKRSVLQVHWGKSDDAQDWAQLQQELLGRLR
ncbi:DUF4259 domain-containing protein [Hymenobacter fodinae]|uniref:DUF4259 domain-containing protein n=1 Tax=Hymenobacter fodinae TaxID=2510796 RepID=A0A4Z0P1A8_9BACT|nr:DUF4259 domain-containing protein [Hymenobacter fodinae]TGE04813.1 DUF4259 domain-containing protein [Hymenobacter fodinae]